MGLAFIPFYVRYLGIEAYGLIGLFAALQAWLTILDLGLTPTLGREMARFTGGEHTPQSIRTLLRSIEVIALVLAGFVGLGVWFASGWIATSWVKAEALDPKTVTAAIGLIGVVIALRFLEGLYRSAVVGLQWQVAYNLVSASMATLRAVGAIGVLVWGGASIIYFFLWQAAVSIVTVALLAGLTYRILPRTGKMASPSTAALKPIYRFAGGMVGITTLAALLTQVDKVFLSRLLPLSEFGAYTLAAAVAGTLYLLVSPITQAFYPRLCAEVATGNVQGFAETYHTAAQLVTVVAGSTAVMVMLFSERLILLWTRDAALAVEIAPLLSVLAMGNLLNALMLMPFLAQVAYGWTALSTRINLVAICVIVPTLFIIVPIYGGIGAAFTWVALNAGYVLLGVRLMHRRILKGELRNWILNDVSKPLSVAVGFGLALFFWGLPDPRNGYLDLIFMMSSVSILLCASGLSSAIIRTRARNLIYSLFA